jgi:hypothetical protein
MLTSSSDQVEEFLEEFGASEEQTLTTSIRETSRRRYTVVGVALLGIGVITVAGLKMWTRHGSGKVFAVPPEEQTALYGASGVQPAAPAAVTAIGQKFAQVCVDASSQVGGVTKYWASGGIYDCNTYHHNHWCTYKGHVGKGWDWDKWGRITDQTQTENGMNALQACCACGGGTRHNVSLPVGPAFAGHYTLVKDMWDPPEAVPGMTPGSFYCPIGLGPSGPNQKQGTIQCQAGSECCGRTCCAPGEVCAGDDFSLCQTKDVNFPGPSLPASSR